MANPVAASKAI